MGEFSRELCGGTHLDNVGQVGLFKIIGEESVAAGTRRITALVGKAALDYVRQEEEILAEISRRSSSVPAAQIGERVSSLARGGEDAQETGCRSGGRRSPRRSPPTTCWPPPGTLGGTTVVIAGASRTSTPDEMRQLIDVLRRKRETGLAVLLAALADGKVHLAAGLTERLDRPRAACRQLAQGGRPDRRRRRRRPARPGPGRRKIPGTDSRRARKSARGHPVAAGVRSRQVSSSGA